jgi:hypothetical protein
MKEKKVKPAALYVVIRCDVVTMLKSYRNIIVSGIKC